MSLPRYTSGTLAAPIAFVGEAWGAEEERHAAPFVGAAGRELNLQMHASGLLETPRESYEDNPKGFEEWMKDLFRERGEHYFFTNLMHAHPSGNDFLGEFCAPKNECENAYKDELPRLKRDWPDMPWPKRYTWSNLGQGAKYLHPKYLDSLPRLYAELSRLPKCTLVVPFGGIARWALTGEAGIKGARGFVDYAPSIQKKILPIYHPAYILRQWEERTVSIADLGKAHRISAYPDLCTPRTETHIPESYADLEYFEQTYMRDVSLLSVDIETKDTMIRCIGIAPDSQRAIVVPLYDKYKLDYTYWTDRGEYARVLQWLKRILESNTPKLAQNGLYDLQYIWQHLGIAMRAFREDTMLLSHSLYPEKQRGLSYLASIFASDDTPAWKSMVSHGDDEKEDI